MIKRVYGNVCIYNYICDMCVYINMTLDLGNVTACEEHKNTTVCVSKLCWPINANTQASPNTSLKIKQHCLCQCSCLYVVLLPLPLLERTIATNIY